MYVDSAPAVNSILCVTINNSPLVGTFLADAGTVTATRLDATGVARGYTYIPPSRGPYWSPTTPAELMNVYVANSRVQAAVVESSVMRPVSGGWWAIPYPDASGSCSVGPGYYVKFREGLPPRQCTRAPAIPSAATCEAWGSDRLLSYLKIATSPGQVPSPSSIPTFGGAGASWVSITINNIYLGNVTSGALNYTDDKSVLTSTYNDKCACTGVLTNIAYTVYYNGATQVISSVGADVVVASLGNCLATSLAPPITVSMVWQDTAPIGTTLPKLDKSGAPGYAWGAPLLGGSMITQSGVAFSAVTSSDRLAVSRGFPYASRAAIPHGASVIAGLGGDAGAALSIRGPNWGGACSASTPSLLSTPGADQAQPVPLSFGEDLAVSCTVALNVVELEAACREAGGNEPPPYMGLWPVYLPPGYATSYATPTHVGTLGASNPWQSWQWTPISTPTYPPATVSWDAANKVCTNMPATLSIELLYSFVGEVNNPQGKVLAVRYKYIPDTWSMKREDTRVATPLGQQTFTFNTVVTWTQDPTTMRAATLYAAAPQIVPALPSDLWYPFT